MSRWTTLTLALGKMPTIRREKGMSAVRGKADINGGCSDVRY